MKSIFYLLIVLFFGCNSAHKNEYETKITRVIESFKALENTEWCFFILPDVDDYLNVRFDSLEVFSNSNHIWELTEKVKPDDIQFNSELGELKLKSQIHLTGSIKSFKDIDVRTPILFPNVSILLSQNKIQYPILYQGQNNIEGITFNIDSITTDTIYANMLYTVIDPMVESSDPRHLKAFKFQLKGISKALLTNFKETTNCKAEIISEILYTNLTLPKVKTGNALRDSRFRKVFNLENLINRDIDQAKKEMNGPQGIRGLGYTVNYNENCLLSITVCRNTLGEGGKETDTWIDGLPYSFRCMNYNYDLIDAKQLIASDFIIPSEIDNLVSKCQRILQDRKNKIKETKKYQDKIGTHFIELLRYQIDVTVLHRTDLENFILEKDSIVFQYDFDFQREIKDFEPSGEVKISYQDLKQFLKPDGALSNISTKAF